jgi:hypothetical protein
MTTTVDDLVCGMEIDLATAAGTSEDKGQIYYFCSLPWHCPPGQVWHSSKRNFIPTAIS